MQWRSTIRIFFCLLVLAAHTHCVFAHGAEMLRESQATNSAESPTQDSETCENESSCICKGATLAEKLDAPEHSDELALWILLIQVGPVVRCVPSLPANCHGFPEPAPPDRETARAFLQLFQI